MCPPKVPPPAIVKRPAEFILPLLRFPGNKNIDAGALTYKEEPSWSSATSPLISNCPAVKSISPAKVAEVPANAPVNVPPASGSLAAILFVTVVAKFGSSPSAAANSFSVSNVDGAESTKLDTAVFTYVCVAYP